MNLIKKLKPILIPALIGGFALAGLTYAYYSIQKPKYAVIGLIKVEQLQTFSKPDIQTTYQFALEKITQISLREIRDLIYFKFEPWESNTETYVRDARILVAANGIFKVEVWSSSISEAEKLLPTIVQALNAQYADRKIQRLVTTEAAFKNIPYDSYVETLSFSLIDARPKSTSPVFPKAERDAVIVGVLTWITIFALVLLRKLKHEPQID